VQGLQPGGIVVDMSTSDPALAREIYAVAQERGCESVDAPVSGGDKGAKAGTLAIMAGGGEDTVSVSLNKCQPHKVELCKAYL
jgi:3-hydroxyisobutyrate dehydrogenase